MSNSGCNGMHIGNIHVFTSAIGPLGAGMVSVFECKDTNNLAKNHLSGRKKVYVFLILAAGAAPPAAMPGIFCHDGTVCNFSAHVRVRALYNTVNEC